MDELQPMDNVIYYDAFHEGEIYEIIRVHKTGKVDIVSTKFYPPELVKNVVRDRIIKVQV